MTAEKTEDIAQAPALVLEGGGFRGMFTAGVLDVFLERGLTGFSSVWGTSAGAMNAVSFKSRQIGRTMRVMLAFRDDKRFMSLLSFAKTGDMAGGEFVYETVQNELDPCDVDAFMDNPMPMYAVASDVTFGTPSYLPVRRLPEDAVKVRASADPLCGGDGPIGREGGRGLRPGSPRARGLDARSRLREGAGERELGRP